jgi:hypothetical protein
MLDGKSMVFALRTARFFVYGFILFAGIFLLLDFSHSPDASWEPIGMPFAIRLGLIGGVALVITCFARSLASWMLRELLRSDD